MSLQTGEGDGEKILKFSEETTTVSATSVDGAPPKMHVLYRDFCLAHTMCHPKGLGCKRHEHKLKSLRTNLEKKRASVKHNDMMHGSTYAQKLMAKGHSALYKLGESSSARK